MKTLFNTLKLAYAPLTAYEFAIMKNDKDLETALHESTIYLICQRPSLTFEKIITNYQTYYLHFEIKQSGNESRIRCCLPLYQEEFGSDNCEKLSVAFNLLDKSKKQTEPPFNNMHGFSILDEDGPKRKFLVWFSPEKLLQNCWNDLISCDIYDDPSLLLKYKVLYVGKATKQHVLDRLKGHSSFQDILSLETPVTELGIPANEIVILFYKFSNNIQLHNSDGSSIQELTDSLLYKNFPNYETISLDAEKALIRAMEPGYNTELFRNYPKSKDGLSDHSFDVISYSFEDPITLNYANGTIEKDDCLIIKNNKVFELAKASKKNQ